MKTLSKIYTFLIMLFLYAPILVMIVYSFNSKKSRSVFGGFSLQWYERLFEDEVILNSLYRSLLIAVLAAIIATVIGTLAAIGINALSKRMRQVFLTVNNIPVVNPEIVTAVSLMILFVFISSKIEFVELGFTTLLFAHISFCIPYVLLSVMPKLRQMDKNIYEAALDLGCSPFKAYWKVVLPEIKSGIITGMIMAFTLSLDDFVISYFTSGSTAQTLPVTIYSMTKKPYSPKINALSTLLFVAVMALLIIVNLSNRKDDAKAKKLKLASTKSI